ncbi:MAG: hypothetical protein R2854_09190 [Caldilineaceae bacterium]
MSVLVWIEQSQGQPVASSLEVAGKARALAEELGTTLAAVVMEAETADVAAAAQTYGVDTVCAVTDPVLAEYRLAPCTAALKQAIAAGATVVLTSATTRDVVIADVACGWTPASPRTVDLRVEGGKLVAVRSVYSSNILADISFAGDVQFASVRPRSFPVPEAGAAGGTVETLDLGAPARARSRPRWSRLSSRTAAK